MAIISWRTFIFSSFGFLLFMESKSQNLCPNPSFETYTACPTYFNLGEPLPCIPWRKGSSATSDYFNVCAPGYTVWIPDNYFGNQKAHTGKAYAGIIPLSDDQTQWHDYREYLQVQLIQPCLAGYTYEASFYISLADNACGSDKMGIYFSSVPPPWEASSLIDVVPQVESNLGIITDDKNWTLISGCFTALGGEQWITIGNFYHDEDTQSDPNCGPSFLEGSYYFIDDVSIVAVPNPNVDLGLDTILCESQLPYVLNVSTSGGNHFVWQDGTTDDTFLVNETGIYSVTVSNECVSVVDQVQVTIAPSTLEVNLLSDQVLCEGQSFVIHNSGDTGEYVWQDGSTADTLLVNTPGVYSLMVSTPCTSASDSIQINFINPVAIPSLGPDLELCPGQQVTLSPGISGVSYLWQDGSTADTFDVTAPGDYSVTISDLCSSAFDTVHVFFNNPPPQLALQPQISLCQDSTVVLDAGISGVTYLWNDSSQASTLVVTNAGTYSLTVSNSCGSDVDSINVLDGGTVPFVSLGDDLSLCPGQSYYLSPVFSNAIDWLWQDGSTSNTYMVTGAGQLYVMVTNGCGSYYDTLVSTLLPPTPRVDLGPDTSICPGNSLLLFINIPDVSLSWSDGSTNDQIQINNSGVYAITISDACGSNTDSIKVTELPPPPMLNLGSDKSLCPGEVIIIDPGISNVDYLWQDSSTVSSFYATQVGNIILTVTNDCGFFTDTLGITNGTPPGTDLGRDTTLCKGSTLVLTAMSDPNTILSWQDGTSTPTFTVSSPGIYILSESNLCGDHRDSIQVSYLSPPQPFELGPDTTLCPGQSLTLSVPQNGFTVQWQDGSSNSTLLADKAQSYSLQLSNRCGLASDQLTLAFYNNEPVIDFDSDYRLCPGDLLTLDAAQLFDADYIWNTGSTEASISVMASGMYAVTISTPCFTTSEETNVIVKNDCSQQSLYIPNIFSPNNDGINDLFSLNVNPEIQIASLHASIFDRWGNLIFDSTELYFDWDGRFHDEPVNPGVYLYLIYLEYSIDGRSFQKTLSGDITLVR